MNEALSVSPVVPEAGESWAEGRLVLPGGVLDAAGARHRTVIVRELTGADEELLADRGWRNAAAQVTALLARVIERVEGIDQRLDAELVSNMLIGDRDYLLLRLRQIALGDHVHEVLRCPSPACARKVDVEFQISEIPVRRADQLAAQYALRLSRPLFPDDEGSARIRLRLPNGADQEAIAELLDSNPGAANTRLYSRLILCAGRRERVEETDARAWPLPLRQEIAAFLRANAPGPDLRIDIACPHCGSDMSYPFDLNAFFLPSGG